LFGHLVDGVVREGHTRVLSLQAVDQVPEDPPSTAKALAVAPLLAEAAATARAHAREQHAVARRDGADTGSDLDDGTHGLVAEDRPRRRLGHVAFEDMKVGAADRGGVDPNDRVGRINDRRIINGVPAALARSVVDERLHVGRLSDDDCEFRR
jgi:hypothetical protein